ncbi:MAG: type IV conjugative transfer system protein TraL [Legionellaceae bacterium]
MASTNPHGILSYLDSPTKFLFWTKGELLLILGPFFLGIFLDAFMAGVVTGAINFWGIKAYQKRFGKGLLQAVRYWYLPFLKKLEAFYDSSIREYV